MNLKRNIFRIVAIIYDIVALFWCCVLARDLIYHFIYVKLGGDNIGLFGGIGYPTAVFEYDEIFRLILPITFIILSLFSVVLLTISAFKSCVKKRTNIWLICLLAGALTLFFLFPYMTLIITLINRLAFRIGVINIVTHILYYIASLGAIGFNVFSLIKRKDETK